MQPYGKARACLDYLRSLLRHKYFVFRAGYGFASTWRLIKHDASKFLPSEFFPYAYYFHGEKFGLDRNKPAFSTAWSLHKQRNDHHWEYWAEFDETGHFVIDTMPDEVMREMVSDWFGASKAYTGYWPKDFTSWTWMRDEGRKVVYSFKDPEDVSKLVDMIYARMDHFDRDFKQENQYE